MQNILYMSSAGPISLHNEQKNHFKAEGQQLGKHTEQFRQPVKVPLRCDDTSWPISDQTLANVTLNNWLGTIGPFTLKLSRLKQKSRTIMIINTKK